MNLKNNRFAKYAALLIVFALCATAVSAGCGKKTTQEGTLKAVDMEAQSVTVMVGEKEVKLSMTESTKVKDAEGNAVKVSELVGKSVKVVSEHAKIDSITQTA